MDTQQRFEKLNMLNQYERVGLAYFEMFGKPMNHLQLYYLINHKNLENPLFNMMTSHALLEQARVQKHFTQAYQDQGLTEQDFIQEDVNVEIEQVLRYINIPKHKHDFWEIVFVLSGDCNHIVESFDSIHRTGDVTIIPPGVLHESQAAPDCVCLTVKVRQSTFQQVFPSLTLENSILSSFFSQMSELPFYRYAVTLNSGLDSFVKDTLLNMLNQQEDKRPFCNTIIEGLLMVQLTYLLQNYQDTAKFLVADSVHHGQMASIISYVFANSQYITLAETARHFNLSMPYLSTKIRKMTGRTFSDLLRTYKLKRASELLVQTDHKLDLICDLIGYRDTAQFIRSFKSIYHMTPHKYRQMNRIKSS